MFGSVNTLGPRDVDEVDAVPLVDRSFKDIFSNKTRWETHPMDLGSCYLDGVDGDGGGCHGGYGFDEQIGVDRGQVQPGHPHAAPRALAVRPTVLPFQDYISLSETYGTVFLKL